MTARSIFQIQTGTLTQLTSSPSVSSDVGIWEPGLMLTPCEFQPSTSGDFVDQAPDMELIPEVELHIVPGPIGEPEETSPPLLSAAEDPELSQLWDNPDDAEYDKPQSR